ncbi:DNA-J related domain-containing protein [Aliiglaciecola litoralis]|uniref:DNA-J related domain-containing protein n=1 Tax=Aliiglaciecola litoralis TaxID=582857 RepID=A0ABP3WPT4_9ALTE
MSVKPELLEALEEIFVIQRQSLSEYNLIGLLQREPYWLLAPEALRESLALFQCHFVLFHHLYMLQDRCFARGLGVLTIHATGISLSESEHELSKQALMQDDPMRAYYLDWTHFDNTQKQDVDKLIDSFWKSMDRFSPVNDDDKRRALALFSLPESYDLKQLKAQYRNLQHQCHPDKGGTVQQSQELQMAFNLLKKALN